MRNCLRAVILPLVTLLLFACIGSDSDDQPTQSEVIESLQARVGEYDAFIDELERTGIALINLRPDGTWNVTYMWDETRDDSSISSHIRFMKQESIRAVTIDGIRAHITIWIAGSLSVYRLRGLVRAEDGPSTRTVTRDGHGQIDILTPTSIDSWYYWERSDGFTQPGLTD